LLQIKKGKELPAKQKGLIACMLCAFFGVEHLLEACGWMDRKGANHYYSWALMRLGHISKKSLKERVYA